MAKVGEGDTRWIVKDRTDGANCGDWHWTEKNLQEWCHARVKQLLETQEFHKEGGMVLKSTSMASITGDCTVMNRKRKVICSFDLQFELSWEGKIYAEGSDDVIFSTKGKFNIPDADDSTVGEDLQVDVSCADSGGSADKVIDAVRKCGRRFVRATMVQFQTELKEKYAVSNKGATKVTDQSPTSPPPSTEPKQEVKAPAPAKKETPKSSNSDMGEISAKYEWRAPLSEMWDTLTNPAKVSAFTRSQAQYDVREGGEFSLLGGGMTGTFTKLDKDGDPKVLKMNWRLDTWDAGHFSEVTISMASEEAGVTLMTFLQTGVPYMDLERTKEGWKRNFWEPIKGIFGFGFERKK